jgi:phosphoribosylaminoimidazole (AIR) synthetase
MPERECYSTWNAGQGVLVVVSDEEAPSFIREASRFGIHARRAGVIERRQGNPRLLIHSKFSGSVLEYAPEARAPA